MAKARHHVQVPGGEDLDGDEVADDPEDPEERGADALDEKLNPHLDADVAFVSAMNNKKVIWNQFHDIGTSIMLTFLI